MAKRLFIIWDRLQQKGGRLRSHHTYGKKRMQRQKLGPNAGWLMPHTTHEQKPLPWLSESFISFGFRIVIGASSCFFSETCLVRRIITSQNLLYLSQLPALNALLFATVAAPHASCSSSTFRKRHNVLLVGLNLTTIALHWVSGSLFSC